MFKNVASQRWIVFAYEDGGGTTPGAPKTGDAANITAKIAKDGAAASGTNDANPTELEDGYYAFDLTQAETNADELLLLPESSTANIQVVGVPGVIYTRPANFGDMGIESDGHVHGDVKEWLGSAPNALASGRVDGDVGAVSGDATAADNMESAYDGTGYDVGGIDVSELNSIVDDLLDAGRLDALIDAIKAKTDSLTFTVAGEVDANTQSINDTTIVGDGDGTPFDV